MIYNEQQCERFSKPPFKYERQQVIDTHTEIRKAIVLNYDKQAIKDKYDLSELPNLDLFLQGSYCNDTNISKSSDVDITIRITNVWRADTSSLSVEEKERYNSNRKDSLYSFQQYNQDIMISLQRYFGAQYITNENKCLKLRNHSKYCDADIVSALTYKLYGIFPSADKQKYTEGICFDCNDGKLIINFPKQHQQALTDKSSATDGNFKETVRMFKNLKGELVDHRVISPDIAKSYFIENLLYNISNDKFYGYYKDRFIGILNELITVFNNGCINNFKCANGVNNLICSEVWNTESLR